MRVGGGGAVKAVRNNLYNANVVEASRVICGHEFSLVDWGGGVSRDGGAGTSTI